MFWYCCSVFLVHLYFNYKDIVFRGEVAADFVWKRSSRFSCLIGCFANGLVCALWLFDSFFRVRLFQSISKKVVLFYNSFIFFISWQSCNKLFDSPNLQHAKFWWCRCRLAYFQNLLSLYIIVKFMGSRFCMLSVTLLLRWTFFSWERLLLPLLLFFGAFIFLTYI